MLVFYVTPVRGGRYFAVQLSSVLVFLICFLVVKGLDGDKTKDRFCVSRMKILNKLSGGTPAPSQESHRARICKETYSNSTP